MTNLKNRPLENGTFTLRKQPQHTAHQIVGNSASQMAGNSSNTPHVSIIPIDHQFPEEKIFHGTRNRRKFWFIPSILQTGKCSEFRSEPFRGRLNSSEFRSELGLATEFHSEKIPRKRLGMASVISRKKLLIPRHSEFYGRVNSEARNGRKYH